MFHFAQAVPQSHPYDARLSYSGHYPIMSSPLPTGPTAGHPSNPYPYSQGYPHPNQQSPHRIDPISPQEVPQGGGYPLSQQNAGYAYFGRGPDLNPTSHTHIYNPAALGHFQSTDQGHTSPHTSFYNHQAGPGPHTIRSHYQSSSPHSSFTQSDTHSAMSPAYYAHSAPGMFSPQYSLPPTPYGYPNASYGSSPAGYPGGYTQHQQPQMSYSPTGDWPNISHGALLHYLFSSHILILIRDRIL